MSDYELDRMFAWTEEGRKERDKEIEGGERGVALTDRPRTFEWIRKKGREPSDERKAKKPNDEETAKKGRWRGMNQLIAAVDRHPLLEGTKVLYEAEIWSFFQETTVTPSELQERIDRLLEANSLVRVPFEDLSPNPGALTNKYSRIEIFTRCLQLSMRDMYRWSEIELVWLLYLQNEPPHNTEFRMTLETMADRLLDVFFRDFIPERHRDYYQHAVNALIQTKLDMSSRGGGGYGALEVIGPRPVIPKNMVGKIEEEHLLDWI